MRNQKGFTLIELMATLAILALIIAIAIPAVGNILSQSEESADDSSIELMERAGELADVAKLPHDGGEGDEHGPVLNAETGVAETEAYRISTLIKEGYLNMETDNKFNKDTNYVVKVNKSGTYVYKGEGQKGGAGEGTGDENEEVTPPETDSTLFTWERLNGSNEFTGTGPFRVTGYIGSDMDIVIPGMYLGEAVLEIGVGAFAGDGLNSAYIPDGVTLIDDNAFLANGLTSIRIPESVVSIGEHAFNENVLASVSIPGEAVEIGGSAFYGNGMTSLTVGGSVKQIGADAFNGNQIETLHLSGDNAVIERHAFVNNEIETLTFSGTFERIEHAAFQGNRLKTVFIPETVDVLVSNAFFNNPGLVLQGVPGGVAYLYEYTDSLDVAPKFEPVNPDGSSLKPAGEADSSDFEWEYVSAVPGPVKIIGYTGSDLDVVIPGTIYGQPVVSFDYGNMGPPLSYMGLTSVYVPESVTSIMDYLFEGNADGFVLKGAKGSVAEQYAETQGFIFEVVE